MVGRTGVRRLYDEDLFIGYKSADPQMVYTSTMAKWIFEAWLVVRAGSSARRV
jgi:hypothetical protein